MLQVGIARGGWTETNRRAMQGQIGVQKLRDAKAKCSECIR